MPRSISSGARVAVSTSIEVTELIPPALATAGQEKVNPAALPLQGLLDEVASLVVQNPTLNEAVVEAARRLRWAERDGTYTQLIQARRSSSAPSRDAERPVSGRL